MPTATGSLMDLGYVEEITPGMVNTTPSLSVFRRRSTSLNLTKDAYESEEVRTDRMTSDMRHGTRRVAGDVVTEMSYGSHDGAYEGLMGAAWSAGASWVAGTDFTNVSSVGNSWTLAGGNPLTMGIKVGDILTVSSAGGADGTYTVSAVTSTSFSTVEPAGAAITNDLDAVITVNGAKLAIGNAVKSYTFERAYTDVHRYQVFKGCRFNSGAFSLPASGLVTVTWGVQGLDMNALANASIDGAASTTKTEVDAGALTVDAGARTLTCATSDWATHGVSVGDTISLSAVTGISGFPDKYLSVTAVAGTVLTVAESVPAGTATAYTLTIFGAPAYTAAPTTSVMASVDATLYESDAFTPLGVVTGLDFSIDNQLGSSQVVGANTVPALHWGNRQTVTGSMTVLFQDEVLYNKFVDETESSLVVKLADPDGNWLSVRLPRVKYSSADIGDAVAEGLPVSLNFTALAPTTEQTGAGWDASTVVFQTGS